MKNGSPSSATAAPSCHLYLIRHAATQNNLSHPPLLQGQGTDVELSAEGLNQAAATAAQLEQLPISAVYSSPLRRAVQTAELIAKPHAIACTVVDALIEVDVGSWENRAWDEIAETEPIAYRQFIDNPAKYPYAGGESFTDVAHRTQPAFEQLMKQHAGEKIVVVGHNVVNRVYLAHVADIPLAKSRDLKQSNCGINVIRHRGNRDQLITLNATLHLESTA